MTAIPLRAAAIPGPREWPGLGWRTHFLPLLRDPLTTMQRLQRRYGDVVALAHGDPSWIFVFAPEDNRQVLSDPAHFYNGDVRGANSPLHLPPDSAALRLFAGLTVMNGAEHLAARRLLLPAFGRGHVVALRETMLERIDAHLDRWHPGQIRDIHREMQELTLGIAVSTILGLDPAHDGLPLRDLMSRWLRLALSPAVVLLPFRLPGLPFTRLLRLADDLAAAIAALLARKRAAGLAGDDALTLLLRARDAGGRALTDAELLGQTVTLFVAGHETTATALTWTLFLLATHPAVQRDLLAELDTVLGGAAPTLEQLAQLPLLDRVIKESLRLLPPGLWFLRVAMADTTIGGYAVPAGTRILWSPAVIHRDPALYPAPDAFRPERWATIDPSPYEYMPFGAGPRRCLGATFAELEMKLVLPRLLQRYRLALRPGTRVRLGGSPLAAPRDGLPMTIRPAGPVPPAPAVRGNIGRFIRLPAAG